MPTKTAQGLETRQGILAVAAKIASVDGLGGLTLGRLAGALAMSKSGLFAPSARRRSCSSLPSSRRDSSTSSR